MFAFEHYEVVDERNGEYVRSVAGADNGECRRCGKSEARSVEFGKRGNTALSHLVFVGGDVALRPWVVNRGLGLRYNIVVPVEHGVVVVMVNM